MAADVIRLSGIVGFGHHGVFESERRDGQRFVVDVACTLDLATAARTDDLRETVDYGLLAQAIVADVERDPLNLIEALADRIARTCLAAGKVQRVEVTVVKPEAPVAVELGAVAVTLTRESG